MSLFELFKDEEGRGLAITIKDDAGTDFATDWIALGDTTILIKTLDLATTKLTVTNANFSNSTPVITWTPTTAQIATSIGVGEFKGLIHLRNDSSVVEVIAEFDLIVHDN